MTTKKKSTKTKPKNARKTKPAPAAPDTVGLTRRTVHMGSEYGDAIAHAKDLGKPYTAGFIIRETLKRHMAGVVQTFKAAKA